MKHERVTEEAIAALIETFYGKVRQDALIGPVFNEAIGDWPHHLEKLQAFWSSVMLGTGRYKGRPMPAHVKHGARISRASFDRWLAIWRATTAELFAEGPAAVFAEKADRIAESLLMGIMFHSDRAALLRAEQAAAAPARWSPDEAA
ncbi:group III truncated hemoglobin [Sphingosinicella sp. BN140058]|uniref:group III truncated hemoglobin n=1 Tax=Sphingosinicella sp. BN140058 TaxID=1892855 RepID=UPI001011240C|nr:group III truncated hemoglobin [Sphingosinicella sp. BN140058]QAY76707.1 group III truncated hemoglobin [Sphingosinicella sp. BN140058]